MPQAIAGLVVERLGPDPRGGDLVVGTLPTGSERSLAEPLACAPGTTITPHLGFVLAQPLEGPGVTAAAARQSVAAVHAALAFGDGDGVTGFVTGPVAISPAGLDLALEAVLVEVGGQVVDSGAGAELLGDPARVLAALAERLAVEGRRLEPGWVLLTGPLTRPVPATAPSVSAHFTHLGSLPVRCI